MEPGPKMMVAALALGQWLDRGGPADDLLAGLLTPDDAPLLTLPSRPPAPLAGLPIWLRATSTDRAWLLLPRPGHVVGWPVPAPVPPQPAVLLTAGAAPVGLMCHGRAGWVVHPAGGSAVAALQAAALSPRQATRRFAEVVGAAAAHLGALGLDRPASTPLAGGWTAAMPLLPPGLDPALAGLLHRIATVLDALHVAGGDDGAAVSAGEAAARWRLLRRAADDVTDVLTAAVAGVGSTLGA